MVIQVTNVGPDAATLHVLPPAWFRNTWSWDEGAPRPALAAADDAPAGDTSAGAVAGRVQHPFRTELELIAGAGPDRTLPTPLFCENETNTARLFVAAPGTADPQDRINDHPTQAAAT